MIYDRVLCSDDNLKIICVGTPRRASICVREDGPMRHDTRIFVPNDFVNLGEFKGLLRICNRCVWMRFQLDVIGGAFKDGI